MASPNRLLNRPPAASDATCGALKKRTLQHALQPLLLVLAVLVPPPQVLRVQVLRQLRGGGDKGAGQRGQVRGATKTAAAACSSQRRSPSQGSTHAQHVKHQQSSQQ